MSQTRAIAYADGTSDHADETSTAAPHEGGVLGPRSRFFKADYPRGIDHYIDYFGGRPNPAPAGGDPCGEAWLERYARYGSAPR